MILIIQTELDIADLEALCGPFGRSEGKERPLPGRIAQRRADVSSIIGAVEGETHARRTADARRSDAEVRGLMQKPARKAFRYGRSTDNPPAPWSWSANHGRWERDVTAAEEQLFAAVDARTHVHVSEVIGQRDPGDESDYRRGDRVILWADYGFTDEVLGEEIDPALPKLQAVDDPAIARAKNKLVSDALAAMDIADKKLGRATASPFERVLERADQRQPGRVPFGRGAAIYDDDLDTYVTPGQPTGIGGEVRKQAQSQREDAFEPAQENPHSPAPSDRARAFAEAEAKARETFGVCPISQTERARRAFPDVRRKTTRIRVVVSAEPVSLSHWGMH